MNEWNYDKQAEMQVLGAMLEEPALIAVGLETIGISGNAFFMKAHQKVYDAMIALSQQGQTIDALAVHRYIDDAKLLNEVGGTEYLAGLIHSNSVAYSDENFRHWANIIATCHRRRQLAASFKKAWARLEAEDDIEDIVGQVQAGLASSAQTQKWQRADKVIEQVKVEKDRQIADKTTYPRWGYHLVDLVLGGLHPAQLVIIAGRPSSGKTTFAQNVAVNVALQNKPVLFLSYETSETSLAKRYIVSKAEAIKYRDLDQGTQDDWWKKYGNEFAKARDEITDKPLFFDYSQPFGENILANVRQFQLENPDMALLVVDYIQLIGMSGKANRYEKVTEISNVLAMTAKKLNICVIALSQLSRSIERRSDTRPMLSDLRESGCLHGDTLLQLSSGKLIRICDLVGQTDIDILSMNACTGKIEVANMSQAVHSGYKYSYKLELASGRNITATANHKFFTVDGWKELSKINIGDVVSTKLVNNDIYWDRVINIEDAGMIDVYDATVPQNGNFIANDIIVHNSLEQDADIVAFIHRPWQFDQSYHPSDTMLVVAKNRNGALEDIPLRFVPSKFRFEGVE
jgi:replicative DNA helicase